MIEESAEPLASDDPILFHYSINHRYATIPRELHKCLRVNRTRPSFDPDFYSLGSNL